MRGQEISRRRRWIWSDLGENSREEGRERSLEFGGRFLEFLFFMSGFFFFFLGSRV